MATAAQRRAAEEAEGQVDPVHADPTQVGVPIDDPAAQEPGVAKGVRQSVEGDRNLYPWEVDPKDQAGPAGEAARKRKKDED